MQFFALAESILLVSTTANDDVVRTFSNKLLSEMDI